MKLRIKSNSIRLRLTKTDVQVLTSTGRLEERTSFGDTQFIYALQAKEDATVLSASLETNRITVLIPSMHLKDWATNNVVGFDAKMSVGNNEFLYLLVEKDFVCLDETIEDQGDNFENPNKPE